MSLVSPLSVETLSAAVLSGIDEVGARHRLFPAWPSQGQESEAPDARAERQEQLAFWLSAQVHALYLDPPGTPPPAHADACAGQNRCRYCRQDFDLLHKRAALLVLGRSGLLEG
ncbi:pyoverdine biosynthesis protein [Pseudomonas protegens]|uniref:Pyoverdine biosynthesis protein n=1 Tax=Pseudomonas protegens TaxID=380021 RepID=A0A2T6GDA1_9PSED|nr:MULTISPECIES: pyoverdine biosynthesis protein [Pseudomonas]PUA42131.1 pyoverdine biosynthesis protein [Pseudomonas protegens]ULT72620.1 hypothetical protein L1O02_09755 [Pseudomonas sp. BC42]